MDLENKQQIQKEYRSKIYPRYILEQSLVPLRPFGLGKRTILKFIFTSSAPWSVLKTFPKTSEFSATGEKCLHLYVQLLHPKICSKTGAIIGREAHPINLLPYVIREHGDVIAQEVLIFYPAYDSTQILSKQRLEYPCRSHNCIHLDCFDGMAFLEFYYDKADWLCPICRIPMPFENVHLDA
ncbi:E3 SUMO-protein ligase PIAS4 [Trichinella spiralis]|uniref:E3 SUMO-protein ligase PIAS4 n=1 Tax=Trichinella spiralis TaxID=6334 RepID=UPI0001EFE3F6|nr:E3 SUMO-protein ligase PIAS4 [Trichinella spiralis]